MVRTLILLFTAISFYSCNSKQEKNTTLNTNKSKDNAPKNDVISIELLKLCNKLYKEVIVGNNTPSIKLSNDGIHKLDIQTHIDTLKTLDLFTEKFLDNEKHKFSKCSNSLKKLRLKKEDIFEEGIEYMEIDGCEFLQYNYYVQSQEKPDMYTIKNEISNDTTSSVEIHFHSKNGDDYYNWDNLIYLHINFLRNEKGNWEVEKITKKHNS